MSLVLDIVMCDYGRHGASSASRVSCAKLLLPSTRRCRCKESAAAKDELLDKADWARYVAKDAGRNRVLAFTDGMVAKETWQSHRGT